MFIQKVCISSLMFIPFECFTNSLTRSLSLLLLNKNFHNAPGTYIIIIVDICDIKINYYFIIYQLLPFTERSNNIPLQRKKCFDVKTHFQIPQLFFCCQNKKKCHDNKNILACIRFFSIFTKYSFKKKPINFLI